MKGYKVDFFSTTSSNVNVDREGNKVELQFTIGFIRSNLSYVLLDPAGCSP